MRKLFVILTLLGNSSYCLAQKNLLYKFEFPYYYTLTVNADNTYGDEVVSYPHELSYVKNASGIHVIYTQGTILIENTDDAFVLGNLAMTYTDENSSDIPILSLLFEEMDL